MIGWQWHQLDYMQIICSILQTDNHASTPSLNFFMGRMLFLTPNQQCQSTEGKKETVTLSIFEQIVSWYLVLSGGRQITTVESFLNAAKCQPVVRLYDVSFDADRQSLEVRLVTAQHHVDATAELGQQQLHVDERRRRVLDATQVWNARKSFLKEIHAPDCNRTHQCATEEYVCQIMPFGVVG